MTDPLYGLAIGVGLAAACGLRVFVPLLVMSGAAQLGYYAPPESFAWIGSTGALVGFGTATVAEVLAFYIPWLDNALDTIASPAAVVAGTVTSASFLTDVSPMMQWGLAAISGGGVAGLVQGGTVATRGASTGTTGGLGNFVVATGELIGSVLLAVLAFVAPVLVAVAVVVLLFFALRRILRWRRDKTG